MLRGDSGVGKSECALALIERGHSLVADDLTVIRCSTNANSWPVPPAQPRLHGVSRHRHHQRRGNVRREMRPPREAHRHGRLPQEWTPEVIEERTGLEENFYEILGMKVPHIELYVRPGRDIARLVEVAALTQALKKWATTPRKISTTA